VNLALGLRRRGHRVSILRLLDGVDLGGELERAGVETASARLRGRADAAGMALRALPWLRRQRPDVLYGFNAQENLLGLLAAAFSDSGHVVWGVRTDDPGALAFDLLGRAGARAQRALARLPDLVISNSRAGALYAARIGVPGKRIRVIPNGIDTREFRPDPEGRARLRAEWRVADEEVLVGTVARLERRKGHVDFLRAAALFARSRPEARFVCVGGGEEDSRHELERLASQLGIAGRVLLNGTRTDMPAVYAALDLATLLSTSGEGSPNAVAEALACGVPCVASDIGESRTIVADPSAVVAPGDPAAAVRAWEETLRRSTPESRAAARRRIESELGVGRMVGETERELTSLLRHRSDIRNG
jgi:glycosyltransferase involved in cell wall biosynthesis